MVFSKPELFTQAAKALPEFCLTRATILPSQHRMPLNELWQVLATCEQCICNTESSFFTANYEQIVGDARLGSIEQKERLVVFLKGIQEVMKNIQEAIRLEPKQVVDCGHYYAESMTNYQPKLDPIQIVTDSSPSAQMKVDSPPPIPAQKRKTHSPPPAPKKQASPLLAELVALGIGTAPVCQSFIEKANVGFADQGVQCLDDLKMLERYDADAMLRLLGLNGIQIAKILKAVFPA
jgi:hypothetical protein